MRHLRTRSVAHRGTAVVEAAIVLPVYLTLLWGIIEIGHAQLVINLLQSSCREGARLGSTEGTSTADVVAKVNQTLGSAIKTNKVSVYVKDASSFDTSSSPPTTDVGIEALPNLEVKNAQPRQMFVVRAKVAYTDIAILPFSFLRGIVLDADSFMRHE